MPDSRVFDWLGCNDKGSPYYLKALNLHWGGDEAALAAVQRFQEVANRLEVEPSYWTEILRTQAWRHTLVGCICILVSQNRNYLQDLRFSFKQGNWVSPQIAVTIGLLHPNEATTFFDEYLSSNFLEQVTKEIASAQCVLEKLNGHALTNTFQGKNNNDQRMYQIAKSVVQHHWDFWSQFSLEAGNS